MTTEVTLVRFEDYTKFLEYEEHMDNTEFMNGVLELLGRAASDKDTKTEDSENIEAH